MGHPRKIIEPGSKFGRWTVLDATIVYDGDSGSIVKCDCGSPPRAVRNSELRGGHSQSCGCLAQEKVIAGNKRIPRNRRHGMYGTPTYNSWGGAKARCRNPRHRKYPSYGGRGIKFDERWDSFENFLADMGECPPGKSLDRIDNDGNYEPGNCRWATAEEQAQNKRPWKLWTHCPTCTCREVA